MKRREFITLIGGAAAAWPLATRAQQGERIRKVGILVPGTPATRQLQDWIAAFRDGLQKLGWVDGPNVVIVERWAVGSEGLVAAAAELIDLAPDVVLTATASATRPMLAATNRVRCGNSGGIAAPLSGCIDRRAGMLAPHSIRLVVQARARGQDARDLRPRALLRGTRTPASNGGRF